MVNSLETNEEVEKSQQRNTGYIFKKNQMEVLEWKEYNYRNKNLSG